MFQPFMMVVLLLLIFGGWVSSALPVPDDLSDLEIKIPAIPGSIVGIFTTATEPATENATPSQSITDEDIVILYDSSADAVGTCNIVLSLMVCWTFTFLHDYCQAACHIYYTSRFIAWMLSYIWLADTVCSLIGYAESTAAAGQRDGLSPHHKLCCWSKSCLQVWRKCS